MVTVNTDAMDKNTTRFKIVFTLVVSAIECLIGIAGNGLITVIHGAESVRGKRLPIGLHSAHAELFQALATDLDDAGKHVQSAVLGHLQ